MKRAVSLPLLSPEGSMTYSWGQTQAAWPERPVLCWIYYISIALLFSDGTCVLILTTPALESSIPSHPLPPQVSILFSLLISCHQTLRSSLGSSSWAPLSPLSYQHTWYTHGIAYGRMCRRGTGPGSFLHYTLVYWLRFFFYFLSQTYIL